MQKNLLLNLDTQRVAINQEHELVFIFKNMCIWQKQTHTSSFQLLRERETTFWNVHREILKRCSVSPDVSWNNPAEMLFHELKMNCPLWKHRRLRFTGREGWKWSSSWNNLFHELSSAVSRGFHVHNRARWRESSWNRLVSHVSPIDKVASAQNVSLIEGCRWSGRPQSISSSDRAWTQFKFCKLDVRIAPHDVILIFSVFNTTFSTYSHE